MYPSIAASRVSDCVRHSGIPPLTVSRPAVHSIHGLRWQRPDRPERRVLGEEESEPEEHGQRGLIQAARGAERQQRGDGGRNREAIASTEVEERIEAVPVAVGAEQRTVPAPSAEHAVGLRHLRASESRGPAGAPRSLRSGSRLPRRKPAGTVQPRGLSVGLTTRRSRVEGFSPPAPRASRSGPGAARWRAPARSRASTSACRPRTDRRGIRAGC